MLQQMISPDEGKRAEGWDAFYGAVNHQGDYYDSTVAAIPFLVEAAAHPEVPERAGILNYFRSRWLDAPGYGGDPVLAEPPGGTDVPTPLLTGAGSATIPTQADDDQEDSEGEGEFDVGSYRRMDLCAWQTGRDIQAGRPTFEKLLDDPDRQVAAAALLLLWPETRAAGKRTLIRTAEEESDPVEQGRHILELGVYGSAEDVATLAGWVAPYQPPAVRAAAALVWAWVVNPAPLPEPAAEAIRDTSAPDSSAFARLPWVGVYHRGPWILPANAAELILRLADNNDNELRWRAVQGLAVEHETAKHLTNAQVVPVLLRRLSDDSNRVRNAAAHALSQMGESVLDLDAAVVPALLRTLDGNPSSARGRKSASLDSDSSAEGFDLLFEPLNPGEFTSLDSDSSACGHVARLLVALAHRLTPAQRQEALAGIERAARRYAAQGERYVTFHGMWTPAAPFLEEQQRLLSRPAPWSLSELFAMLAFPNQEAEQLSTSECDGRLADAYTRAPQQTIAAAVQALDDSSNRSASLGAAEWLSTLGPAAEPALPTLDEMAQRRLDSYHEERVRAAREVIRSSLLVTPDPGEETSAGPGGPPARNRIASLTHALEENALSAEEGAAAVPELIAALGHSDPYVRAGSADLLATLAPAVSQVSPAIPALERLLADDAVAAVGISGLVELEGRLYHWREERRCPREAALRALFTLGWVPPGDRMLRAMLAESTRTAVLFGGKALPHCFTLAQWRSAVAAAGGLAVADPMIRTARQQCRNQAWSGNKPDPVVYAAEAELAEVIRHLSGRLV
jgi:HEAT repeat protein